MESLLTLVFFGTCLCTTSDGPIQLVTFGGTVPSVIYSTFARLLLFLWT